jgi:acyl-CoA thioesterase I
MIHSSTLRAAAPLAAALFASILMPFAACAQAEADKRPNPQSSPWRVYPAESPVAGLPRVLLIGDSVMNGYRAEVSRLLQGKANVDAWVTPHHQASPELPQAIKDVLANGPYRVIHFNMGLHGWPKGRIPEGQFEPLMQAYVAAILQGAAGAQLIWGSTTPVTVKGRPSELDPEINATIVEHNRLAAKVVGRAGIPIDDLYALAAAHLDLAKGDQFHWTADGYRLMAASAASAVTSALRGPAPPSSYLAAVMAEMQKDWPANRTVNIVFHGHSVPAGYFKTPVVRSLEAYPHMVRAELARRFPHAMINVIVSAKGGEDSVPGAARFERDVLAHNPDVVLIDYSLNDRRPGLAAAREAWTTMIRMATARGAKVILLTPTPDQRVRFGDPFDSLEAHAAQVRRLAAEMEVGLADSFAAFKIAVESTPLPAFMSQVNHPNAAGHRLVAEAILKYFEKP